MRDTPEFRELQAENAALRQRLELNEDALARAEFSRNQFLSNMSHELRTPLTAILGLSEALEVGLYGICSEEQCRAFRTINDCGKSLLGLINDILDVTKLELHQLSLNDDPVSASQLLQSVVRLHKQPAKSKEVIVHCQIDASAQTFAGDATRLKQLLSHLLSNAIKFSPPQSEVTLSCEQSKGIIVFRVTDRGLGIDQESIEKIFEPFQQLDEGFNRVHPGAGLGLNLAKKLAVLMGATIEVQARGGGGTEFIVKLPFQPAVPPPSLLFQSLRGDGLVLVVDDHHATAELLRVTLTSWGFQVKSLEGARAFKSYRPESPVKLILMDAKLPDGAGVECIRWLREQESYRDSIVILLTAQSVPFLREQGLQAGAQDFLSKPLELAQLAGCISQHLGQD